MNMNNFNDINNQMDNLNLFNMNNGINNININNMNQMYQNNNMNLNNMNFQNVNNMNNYNNNMNMMNNINNFMNNQYQINNMNNLNQFNDMNNDINLNNNFINENSNNLLQKKLDFNNFSEILEKTKNCVCLVGDSKDNVVDDSKDKFHYTIGFFCKVFYNNKKYKLLLTYYNKNLNKNDFIECHRIDFSNLISISPNDQRNIYLNQKYNILIFEIKDYEEIDYFYEYDCDNSEENSNSNDLNEKGNLLYLLSLNKKNEYLHLHFAIGILNNFIDNEIDISFDYDKGFLGCPIINITNNKLIGILSSSDKGISLKYILKEYFLNNNNAFVIDISMNNFQQMNLMEIQQYQMEQLKHQNHMDEIKNKNQIKIKVEVNFDFGEINKRIKFFNKLDNIDKDDIEIYINDIKFEYQNWFIAGKKGIYNIKLIFKKNIKDCSQMFARCYDIIELDLSCFNTKNVINMKEMFFECERLKTIDLSNFNTENVTNMESMFCECYELNHLDVSSFNTKKVNTMYSMFAYTALKYLDLSSFDFNCNIMNIIGGTQLKEIKMKKNNEVENQLYQFIKYFNGKITIV